MARIDVLRSSLEKKSAELDRRFENHFDSVKAANGQPLNDKRGGQAVLNRWDRQSDGIRRQKESIERTKAAIERQESKDLAINRSYNSMPDYLRELIDDGTLKQWGKFPHIMFVAGVDKARIYWDEESKVCSHKFARDISDQEQYAIFKAVFNSIKQKEQASQ